MKFLFYKTFNLFDIFCIAVVAQLMATNFWWLALILPCMILSVLGESFYERKGVK